MSIDETSLSNSELYTFLSNKDAHCKKGSIAAYVKGTKSDDIVEVLMRIPEEIRSQTIVFSILTNNCTSPSWKVRPLLDKIMVTLASAN